MYIKSNKKLIKMSFTVKRTTKVNTKPFCKVCHDAGLSEKEYTSHYVKSEPGPQGKVVCPTLLAQECRFCFGLGHTASYCPIIAVNKKAEENALRKIALSEKKIITEPKRCEKKSTNTFSSFNSDDDSGTDEKIHPMDDIKIVEEFPALSSSAKKVAPKTTIVGYASVAAKKPEQYDNTKYEQKLILKSNQRRLPPIKRNDQRKIHAVRDDDDLIDVSDVDSSEEEELKFTQQKEIIKRTSLLDWATQYESEEEHW